VQVGDMGVDGRFALIRLRDGSQRRPKTHWQQFGLHAALRIFLPILFPIIQRRHGDFRVFRIRPMDGTRSVSFMALTFLSASVLTRVLRLAVYCGISSSLPYYGSMSLENNFDQYPNLKAVFWPGASKIKWTDATNPHPLLGLVQGTDERTKCVAGRTDACCRALLKVNPIWLKAKASIILSDAIPQNISATLGEIRAFGELNWVWQDKVIAGKSRHDFGFTREGQNIRIEVFTSQHRTKRNRIEHKPSESKRMKSQVIECFPFGWPERRGKDNVQGEAVSKLAGIKQDEHQFSDKEINILWCDLKDPVLWPFGFGRSQFAPLSIFQEQMTSGAFWNAFYARKNTPIFDTLPVGGYEGRKPYLMEYDGRFWQKTKVDFVIANILQSQIVFQNPNQTKTIPDWLFRDLHRLFAFDLRASWLDWPCPGQLKLKVEMALDSIAKYATAFQLPDDEA
jgi:hypothetical protein